MAFMPPLAGWALVHFLFLFLFHFLFFFGLGSYIGDAPTCGMPLEDLYLLPGGPDGVHAPTCGLASEGPLCVFFVHFFLFFFQLGSYPGDAPTCESPISCSAAQMAFMPPLAGWALVRFSISFSISFSFLFWIRLLCQ